AQRLAAARRHEHDRVATADQVVDDRGLLATELRVAEDAVQHLEGGGGGHEATVPGGTDAGLRGCRRWGRATSGPPGEGRPPSTVRSVPPSGSSRSTPRVGTLDAR